MGREFVTITFENCSEVKIPREQIDIYTYYDKKDEMVTTTIEVYGDYDVGLFDTKDGTLRTRRFRDVTHLYFETNSDSSGKPMSIYEHCFMWPNDNDDENDNQTNIIDKDSIIINITEHVSKHDKKRMIEWINFVDSFSDKKSFTEARNLISTSSDSLEDYGDTFVLGHSVNIDTDEKAESFCNAIDVSILKQELDETEEDNDYLTSMLAKLMASSIYSSPYSESSKIAVDILFDQYKYEVSNRTCEALEHKYEKELKYLKDVDNEN